MFATLKASTNFVSTQLRRSLQMPQSLAKMWIHLIFSTKKRYPFLTDKQIRLDTQGYLATVLRNHDCETLIVGGVEDHIHALFSLSRNYSIADIVKDLKVASSKSIKEKLPALKKFGWQSGYGAFSVSQSHLDQVTRYIERQEEHHMRVTFQDEYRAFLKKYRVEYDERYVWD
jgi:REP element-mobilizing transposase RayT